MDSESQVREEFPNPWKDIVVHKLNEDAMYASKADTEKERFMHSKGTRFYWYQQNPKKPIVYALLKVKKPDGKYKAVRMFSSDLNQAIRIIINISEKSVRT